MRFIKHGYKVEDDELLWDYLPKIPVHSPFGHLGEKFVFLMYRLHYTEETVRELFYYQRLYFECRQNHQYTGNIKLKILHRSFRFASEMKIIFDEFISLYFILNYHKQNNKWPTKISIDSIGAYLSDKNTIKYDLFEKHKDLIITTNNIGNAIKHSFVNSETTWLRNDAKTPVLLAYRQKQNDTKNPIVFHGIELPNYLDLLNAFLPEFNYDVKNNYT
jgi:hypothetical protein